MSEEQDELIKKGKKRALHLLEKKDYSRKELQEKLVQSGYGKEIQEEIFKYLDSFHYLDDLRVASVYIRNRKDNKSKRELEFFLKNKGISEEDIALAMEEQYRTEDGISQEEVALHKQLQKYHVTEEDLEVMSYEEKQKLAAKFYRKGYSGEKIRKVLGL